MKPDTAEVKRFFEARAARVYPHRYNKVNYDIRGTPAERFLERDRIEKRVIARYVPVRPDDRVLDIGCGVGRWADEIVPQLDGGLYTGLDFSERMLDEARERFEGNPSVRFIQGDLADLPKLAEGQAFTRIHINGVLEYVDDCRASGCLMDAGRLLAEGGFLYVKEPVAAQKRFMFDGYSEALDAQYQAIYRTAGEYVRMFMDALNPEAYDLIVCGPSWEETFNAAEKTCNMFWIIRKKESSHETFRC